MFVRMVRWTVPNGDSLKATSSLDPCISKFTIIDLLTVLKSCYIRWDSPTTQVSTEVVN